MTSDYTLVCLSEALAPITHMASTSGNEALISREPVVTPRGVAMIPFLSGNALRHRAVRAPGALWLIREYGLQGKLTLPQLNFLLHGGSLTEGGGREDTRRIAEMQRLWPLLRLVGGCLPDQILAGSLQVWRGALVCAENRPYLAAILPDPDLIPDRLRSAESLVSGYLYTRGDSAAQGFGVIDRVDPESLARRDAVRAWVAAGKPGGPDARPAGDRGADPDGKAQLMPFAGQAVCRGAAFVHGFTLPHVGIVEVGALLWSLRLWQAEGGTVGGQAARGHGRLALSLIAPDFDPDDAVATYLDHARAVKDEAVAWLDGAFAARQTQAEKAAVKQRSRRLAPSLTTRDGLLDVTADVDRLRAKIAGQYGVDLTPEQVRDRWEDYSNSVAAGWLSVDSDPDHAHLDAVFGKKKRSGPPGPQGLAPGRKTKKKVSHA